jgi:hypothetical protein
MIRRSQGKHVNVDFSTPGALGICDFTGFVFRRRDMVKQMEWRGNRLVWTGYIVGRPYADMPNPQLKPPMLKPDPVPVRNPRDPQGQITTWSTIQSPVFSELEILTWTSWGDYVTLTQVDLIGPNTGFEFGPEYGQDFVALPENERLFALNQVRFSS